MIVLCWSISLQMLSILFSHKNLMSTFIFFHKNWGPHFFSKINSHFTIKLKENFSQWKQLSTTPTWCHQVITQPCLPTSHLKSFYNKQTSPSALHPSDNHFMNRLQVKRLLNRDENYEASPNNQNSLNLTIIKEQSFWK